MTAPGQGELIPRLAMPTGPAGPLELATRRSIEAAQLDPRDEAGAVLALRLAAVLDVACHGPKFYVVAPIAQQYRETLAQYGLAPDSREGETNELDALLAQLAAPAVGNAENT